MTWIVSYGFIFQGYFFIRKESGHSLGETPMMDQSYAKRSAEKLASEYTLKEVREHLQNILDEKNGTHKDTVKVRILNHMTIYNNPTFNLDKDPSLEKNKEAKEAIINMGPSDSQIFMAIKPLQKWFKIGLNTFDDVFAHCEYFKIPENKDSRYLTEYDDFDDRTGADVSCIINLDNPVEHARYVGGKADDQIFKCFEMEIIVNPKRLPLYFSDEKDCESYPNMMHHGASYYWLHFKK
jgi:hypothetical protein